MVQITWDYVVKHVGKRSRMNPYVIHKTLQGFEGGKNIDKAFVDACEDENMYGTRSDIVTERRVLANHLKTVYGLEVSDYSVELCEVKRPVSKRVPKFMRL